MCNVEKQRYKHMNVQIMIMSICKAEKIIYKNEYIQIYTRHVKYVQNIYRILKYKDTQVEQHSHLHKLQKK